MIYYDFMLRSLVLVTVGFDDACSYALILSSTMVQVSLISRL